MRCVAKYKCISTFSVDTFIINGSTPFTQEHQTVLL